MKKTYIHPQVSEIAFKPESLMLGASQIIDSNSETEEYFSSEKDADASYWSTSDWE